ncbi:MAG: L-lactate permease, partial [Lachnospiraceae bacterium]|nr:L-lactate permease [Lachnospiraceae bacterium]
VLALGWIFESFLQGITGFGVPVAVGAPLLIGLGVKPLWAVIIPLMGQSWGNTYGTLGAAWDALTMTSGMTVGSEHYLATAFFSAVLLWIWNAVIGLSICWFYGKGAGLKKGLPAVLVLSALQGGGELVMTQFNTTVACFIPACLSLFGILFLGKTGLYRDPWSLEDSRIMERKDLAVEEEKESSGMSLMQAILPYIILSVITLVVLMVEPVKNLLGTFKLSFAFPETVTGYGFVNEAVDQFSPLSPFTHASMFLLVSSLAGLFYYRSCGFIKEGGAKQVFTRTVKMARPSSIAVLALVIMSKIMSGTGQTVVLANGIAATLGNAYVALAPFIGMLGSFMTGSNMSSNILFGSFQTATAEILGVNSSFILGAQTAGGSIGSAISPSNIVLGTTTANILGHEGDVLKRTGSIVIPVALLMGAIVFLMIG